VNEVDVMEVDRSGSALLAAVHLRTVLIAYRHFFQADQRGPTEDDLTADWVAAFSDPTFRAFLAKADTDAVGTVAVRADPRFAGFGELCRLHVLPEHWATGIGGVLHDVALRALRETGYRSAGLWVIEANVRARTFYEHRGWSLVDDQALDGPGGVLEVRYQLVLR
jgi:GNAT superfamily N-acetyltransferase